MKETLYSLFIWEAQVNSPKKTEGKKRYSLTLWDKHTLYMTEGSNYGIEISDL